VANPHFCDTVSSALALVCLLAVTDSSPTRRPSKPNGNDADRPDQCRNDRRHWMI